MIEHLFWLIPKKEGAPTNVIIHWNIRCVIWTLKILREGKLVDNPGVLASLLTYPPHILFWIKKKKKKIWTQLITANSFWSSFKCVVSLNQTRVLWRRCSSWNSEKEWDSCTWRLSMLANTHIHIHTIIPLFYHLSHKIWPWHKTLDHCSE